MASRKTDAPDWQPRACAVPTCGRQLQAPVAYCPFCGTAQAATATAVEVPGMRGDETDVAGFVPVVPAAASVPAEPPPVIPIATPPEAPPTVPPTLPLESTGTAELHLPPPVPIAGSRGRRWPMVLVGMLVLAGLLFWLRPQGGTEPSADIAQCHALTTEIRIALAAGNAVAAEPNLIQARSVCGEEQNKVIDALESQLGTLKTQMAACTVLEKKLRAALDNGHPREVSGQVAKAPRGCASQPAITSLVERGARQVEQATAAINDGFDQLNAGDLDGADATLARALRIDTRTSGAAGLRSSLVKARQVAVNASAAVASVAAMQPKPTPPVPGPVDGVLNDLLSDGRQALQRKNYAEAKSAAKSALRLSPGNRPAQALLRDAENGEREALTSMPIR